MPPEDLELPFSLRRKESGLLLLRHADKEILCFVLRKPWPRSPYLILYFTSLGEENCNSSYSCLETLSVGVITMLSPCPPFTAPLPIPISVHSLSLKPGFLPCSPLPLTWFLGASPLFPTIDKQMVPGNHESLKTPISHFPSTEPSLFPCTVPACQLLPILESKRELGLLI